MYENLASVYEDIFPLKPLTLDFVRKCLLTPSEDSAILDVGCATGELCRALAELGYPVVGVEPDREMVAQAKILSNGDIPFYPVGMESVASHFPESSFTAVLCLGNTLAHLPDSAAMNRFFTDVARLLVPGGRFLFQIVNFDRLSPDHLPGFPVIERTDIRFSQQYKWTENYTALRFITTLENLSDHSSQTGECRLFPAKKADISNTLLTSGFSNQKWFGSYKGDPFTPESPAAICITKNSGE